MSLSTALFNAKSGLSATSRQVSGSSNNIANARTPGYVALEARVSARNTAGIGSGVAADMVRSPVDSVLLKDLRLEAARLGTLDVRAASTQRVADVSGNPADERSLAFALTKLETAMQQLYDAPERSDLQRQVFYAARELTDRFGDLQGAIKTAREEADRNIAAGVDVVNENLAGIAELNRKIAEGFENPEIDISGILDERDRLIDEVAEQIGIRTYTRERGEVVITTTEGVTLLDRDPRPLTFTRTTSIDPATRIDILPTGLSGLQVDGFNIEPGPLGGPQALRSGSIAGNFLARDVDLVLYQEQIDALAKETIVMFQETDATVVPGGPPFEASVFTDGAGLGVDPAETAANIIGLAGDIQLNALFDPDQPGGDLNRFRDGVNPPVPGNPPGFNGQVEAFLDGLSNARNFNPAAGLTPNLSLQNFASELVTGLQNDRADLQGQSDRVRTIFDTLENRRFNENGVNVDEESEKLLELEQAYAANAQVINIVARMFDELLARIA